MRTLLAILLLFPLLALAVDSAEPHKPAVAVFPITGDAKEDLRDRTSFALRAKLDRSGKFEVVDGPRMKELVTDNNASISLEMTSAQVRELARQVDADIAVWGELSGTELKVKLLDLRRPDAQPKEVDKPVKEPTDLRFAVEGILQEVEGVGAFEHPVEESVWHDETAEKLWKTNPNLALNGDFSAAGKWTGIYQSELYELQIQNGTPAEDKIAIVSGAGEAGHGPALVMNLSKTAAENNGLATLSDPIKIEPGMRYRLQFRYQSLGPVLHVFVKGYTQYRGPTGKMQDREIYRRQVPVSGSTEGNWVTITDDLNPQHASLPVQTLRIDLYAYLKPGVVTFDDVVLKAVGKQTRQAKDAAIK